MPTLTKNNVLLRMMEDLSRALKRPLEKRGWGMLIDTRKCIGCSSCVIACKSENVTPIGVSYMVVFDEETGTYPNVSRRFLARPCFHCDNPSCVPVCPVKATYKRPDGIVVVDYEKCIGCRYCLPACPYGARYSDFGAYYTDETPIIMDYEKREFYEYGGTEIGKKWKRMKNKSPFKQSPIGNARKCTFCLHRLNKGLLPACVTTCLGRSLYFGDLHDPESLVNELRANYSTTRLKEELGNKPKVYYLL
ncbi:MAG: 4Fe-4S dicluster domain-containing protein [Actinobacteria bacterium]|nr:4Fe-4S dicluster domain-containing protein [Actinomycetota bacterium]